MSGHFDTEQIVAYLDGELDSAKAKELERAVETDSALKKRIADLQFPKNRLKSEADALLTMAPQIPSHILGASEAMQQVPRFRMVGYIAASLVIGTVLGGVFLDQIFTNKNDKWIEAIASYQALYVEETLAAVVPNPIEDKQRIQAFAKDHNLDLDAIATTNGLSLKRVQSLGFKGRPLLQITFAGEGGEPVALCLVAVDQEDQMASLKQYDDMNGISWIRDGVGFLMIGRVPERLMSEAIETWKL